MSDPFADDVVALLPNLRRFAISICRSRDTADDLVQITVERAFAARASFDPTTRLDAWLFRILRNAWYDMLRRTRTRGTEIDIADALDAPHCGWRENGGNRSDAAIRAGCNRPAAT